MPNLFAIDLFDESNPRKNKKSVKPNKKQVEEVVAEEKDLSEIGEIKKAINEVLFYLNGNFSSDYFVRVCHTKQDCFRAIVFKKESRKVLIDFFVEKIRDGEYVYTPPLDINAFTVNSYENRNKYNS